MQIRVVILEDHQSIVDGYRFRLGSAPDIEIVATPGYGDELEPLLAAHPAEVVILDVNVPTDRNNPNPYPILHVIPRLLNRFRGLSILVISMLTERAFIQAVMDAGASGYILKDDRDAIERLGAILASIARGEGIYLSQQAHHQLFRRRTKNGEPVLTPRQMEALSLCAAHPGWTHADLASSLNVANSTARNILSGAYLRLEVHNLSGAIAKARQLGLITPAAPDPRC